MLPLIFPIILAVTGAVPMPDRQTSVLWPMSNHTSSSLPYRIAPSNHSITIHITETSRTSTTTKTPNLEDGVITLTRASLISHHSTATTITPSQASHVTRTTNIYTSSTTSLCSTFSSTTATITSLASTTLLPTALLTPTTTTTTSTPLDTLQFSNAQFSSAPSTPSPVLSEDTPPAKTIIAASVGAPFGAALVFAAAFLLFSRRRQQQNRKNCDDNYEYPGGDPYESIRGNDTSYRGGGGNLPDQDMLNAIFSREVATTITDSGSPSSGRSINYSPNRTFVGCIPYEVTQYGQLHAHDPESHPQMSQLSPTFHSQSTPPHRLSRFSAATASERIPFSNLNTSRSCSATSSSPLLDDDERDADDSPAPSTHRTLQTDSSTEWGVDTAVLFAADPHRDGEELRLSRHSLRLQTVEPARVRTLRSVRSAVSRNATLRSVGSSAYSASQYSPISPGEVEDTTDDKTRHAPAVAMPRAALGSLRTQVRSILWRPSEEVERDRAGFESDGSCTDGEEESRQESARARELEEEKAREGNWPRPLEVKRS